MVENATLLLGYRTYPHVDMLQTGRRTAQLLLHTLAGTIRPVMALSKRPLLVSPVNARTDIPPLATLAARARRLERNPAIIATSLFPVQPWLDVPGLGFAALAIADGSPAASQTAADTLAAEAWDARDAFKPDLTTLDQALDIAGASHAGPVVIGDAGDAPSCGATGDSPAVLQALLARGLERSARAVLLTLCDPPAARTAAAAGLGATVELTVGHALTELHGERAPLQGVVEALRNAPFQLDGPGAHGMRLDAGQIAVIRSGSLHVVLTSRPVMEWDSSLYRAVELEPERAGIVFVKSPSHFRAAYASIAHTLLIADTPGASRCNLRELHFTQVGYPLYPLEENSDAS
jgi:microcystin degradation protein MlrC